ncbi:putative 115 kDa protein in type-1 like protein [Argiope bruennichi]|uniref:Putative 115 kDa protein in type-1 like protein n=1 Tax=Argiope bruennichi TaxID=94029 RepID=A0A8T0FHT7_ARGBR|nr:putative 115 kDa protein in type-1 like protein [Argiope bruennichi]
MSSQNSPEQDSPTFPLRKSVSAASLLSSSSKSELYQIDENTSSQALIDQLRKIINHRKESRYDLKAEKRELANKLLNQLERTINTLEIYNPKLPIVTEERSQQTEPAPTTTNPCPFPQEKTTYAQAAAPKTTTKTVLLYPTKEGETDLVTILKKEVAPSNTYKIQKVRRLQNQGLAIECNSEEDRASFLTTLTTKPSLQEKIRPIQVERKLPRLITYGYQQATKKEEVEEGLRLNFNSPYSTEIKVLFSIKGKTGKIHWVFQAPPPLCQVIRRRGNKILFEWENHRVEPFRSVRRCTKCQAFDHTTARCDAKRKIMTQNHPPSASRPLKLLQINLGKAKVATDILHPAATKIKPDIIALQEPYQNNGQIKGLPNSWPLFCSSNRKAAIALSTPTIKIAIIGVKTNSVAIKIQTSPLPTTIISAYSSPASNLQEALEEIQDLIDALPREQILIAADLNGHNNLWGYEHNDPRGNQILDFALANTLFIINKQDAPPTFTHCGTKGWPDLTLCSQNLIHQIAKWEVLEEPSLSDHKYIETTIATNHQISTITRYKTKYGNHNKMLKSLQPNVTQIQQAINNSTTHQQLNEATTLLQEHIISACKNSYKLKTHKHNQQPNWFTPKLEIEKNRLKALRRRAQRSAEDRQAKFLHLKQETAKYMKAVRTARKAGWKGFCSQATNPFGKHYKSAFRSSITPAQLVLLKNKDAVGGQLKIASDILEEIFPHPTTTAIPTATHSLTPDDCPFSKSEVFKVINGLPKGKAPGLDGIDNIAENLKTCKVSARRIRPLPPLGEFSHQLAFHHHLAGQHVRPLPSSLASSNGPLHTVSSSTMTLLPPPTILLSNKSPLPQRVSRLHRPSSSPTHHLFSTSATPYPSSSSTPRPPPHQLSSSTIDSPANHQLLLTICNHTSILQPV